jgi:hypothetical protein
MKTLIKILVFILPCIVIVSGVNHDSSKCDQQLDKFDVALEDREFWALKCKKLRNCLNSIKEKRNCYF